MRLTCPHCSQTLEIDPGYAGQNLPCPSCQKEFAVPALPKPVVVAIPVATAAASPDVPKKLLIGLGVMAVVLLVMVIVLVVRPPQNAALSTPAPVVVVKTQEPAATATSTASPQQTLGASGKGALVAPPNDRSPATNRVFLSLNHGRLPAGTVLTDQYAAQGLRLSAKDADGKMKADFVVRSDPTKRWFWLGVKPDVLGAVGVFDFVLPGTTSPAKACYFSCWVRLSKPEERVELVGLDTKTGRVVARARFDGPLNFKRPLEIFGSFDRAEVRFAESTRLDMADWVDVAWENGSPAANPIPKEISTPAPPPTAPPPGSVLLNASATATPAPTPPPEPLGPPPIDIQWQQTFGGAGQDEALAIRETKDGGYIVVGSSMSPIGGTKASPSFGKQDWWLLRLDASGKQLWEKSYGGTEFDVARDVVVVEDGFLVAGITDSKADGNKTAPSLGTRDVWLMKVDLQGDRLWDKSLGGPQGDSAWRLEQTGPNRFLLAGASGPPIGGRKHSPNFGNMDFWLLAMDGAGTVAWDRSFGGDKFDAAYGMAPTTGGGALLVGATGSGASGNKTSANLGDSDGWLVRVDPQGHEVWQRALGGPGFDELKAAVPTDDGGFLVVGNSGSAITNTDVWVVRLNAEGKTLWERTFGGTARDITQAVVKTRNGGFLCLSEANSGRSGNKSSLGYGQIDTWLIRLDARGKKLWEMALGGAEEDRCFGLLATRDGGYIIAGLSASPPNQSKTAPYFGGRDVWVIKLGPEKL